MRLEPYLEQLAAKAIADSLGEAAPALLRPADPAHGDYQINGALPLAKRLGKNPRELAAPLAEALAAAPCIEAAEVAGPGFVNLRLSPIWIARELNAIAVDRERDGVPAVDQPKKTVVDYSAPNVAKPMHVGHIRSTVIGAALCRVLRYVGHEVIADNHIGDWGTQFGKVLIGVRRFGDPEALEARPIDELERCYKLAHALSEKDPAVADEARAELAKLQQGDPENLAMWRKLVATTRAELDRIYDRLDVEFDMWRGESAYEPMLPAVVERLLAEGIAREDEGAVCVFFDDHPKLKKSKTPFIVRKRDGAFLYSTTDIATVLWRRDELGAERALYVVDKRQALHFEQLFATVERLGVAMELQHVSFGTILGANGKPLKTREGDLIRLSDLLDEAQQRAGALMQAELEVREEDLEELAPIVGIGAIKYADLSQNRNSDYRFDWDKLISFKGNASPYLQYAHARIASIFRKGEVDPDALDPNSKLELTEAAELALAKHLMRFADAVHQAAESALPHLIADHLYALARAFSVFFESCPVLRSEGTTRSSRLLLCWLTARQLRRGLGLLGIEAPERM